jgi:hypothetical protein
MSVSEEREKDDVIEAGRSYPVWSPDRAFTAAAALLQALEAEKRQTIASAWICRQV